MHPGVDPRSSRMRARRAAAAITALLGAAVLVPVAPAVHAASQWQPSAHYDIELATFSRPDTSARTTGLARVALDAWLGDEGLHLHAGALWLHGATASGPLAGDHGASNIAGEPAARLAHLTLEVPLPGGSLRVGRLDVDSDFLVLASHAALLNSSFGVPATLAANAPIPTYPLPGLGLIGRVAAADGRSIAVGVLDGDVGEQSDHPSGLSLDGSGVGGALALGQGVWPLGGGRLIAGAAVHTGRFAAGRRGERKRGNGMLWVGGGTPTLHPCAGCRLVAGMRVSAAPPADRNAVGWQVDAAARLDAPAGQSGDWVAVGLIASDGPGGRVRTVGEVVWGRTFEPRAALALSLQHLTTGAQHADRGTVAGIARLSFTF